MEMAILGLVLCLGYGVLDSWARRSHERHVRRIWETRRAEYLKAVGTA